MTRFELRVRVSESTRQAARASGWDQVHYFWAHHSYLVDDITVVGDFDEYHCGAYFCADVVCEDCNIYLEEIRVECERFSSITPNNIELTSEGPCLYCCPNDSDGGSSDEGEVNSNGDEVEPVEPDNTLVNSLEAVTLEEEEYQWPSDSEKSEDD